MGMFLFTALLVASVFWIFKLLKPIVFIINNEAVMYNLHNPLNFNLVKYQAAMMISASVFAFITTLLCCLVLFDVSDISGKIYITPDLKIWLHVSIWFTMLSASERIGYVFLNTLTQQVEVDFYLTFACHYYIDKRNTKKEPPMRMNRSESQDSPK